MLLDEEKYIKLNVDIQKVDFSPAFERRTDVVGGACKAHIYIYICLSSEGVPNVMTD